MESIRLEDFMKRFMLLSRNTKTYREAYELTETEFESKFGARKFTGYSHFRTIKTRFYQKNKQNATS